MSRLRDGHIGYMEAIAFVVVTIIAKIIILPLAGVIAEEGRGAGWLIIIIGLVVSFAGLLPLVSLLKRNPEFSIIEITENVIGKFFGTFFNLIIFISFFLSAVIGTREFVELVKISVLPMTPISILIALFVLASLYANYQGIESLTRANWLFVPFIALALIVILIGVYPFMKPHYIFPVFGTGVVPVLKSGLFRGSLFADILILGIIAPYIRKSEKITKIAFWGVGISALIMTAATLIFYTVFLEQSSKITFPVYQLARLIYFGRFVQRVEVIFVIIWCFVGLARTSIGLYAAVISMAEILKLPTYKPILFPITLLLYTFCLLPTSFLQLANLDVILRGITITSGIIFPLIIFLVAAIRKQPTGNR